jgi:hypothetical protein
VSEKTVDAERTQEKLDLEAAGLRSPDKAASLRLAAILIVVNVLLVLLVCLVLRSQRVPLIQCIVALGVARHLYRLRPSAEAWALGLSVIAGVIGPLLFFRQQPFLAALLDSLPVWGVSGALILLLVGEPGKGRRALAVALFCVLTVGLYVLAIAGHYWR